MGSGASKDVTDAIAGKTPEEIAAALKELPADHLAKIKDACMEKKPCPGPVDCSSITVVAKDYKGMLDQPSAPKFKGALAQIYVRTQPYGGSDKSNNGHRYDSIPIVNGMITAGMSCQLIHYTHEEHDKFFELCKNFDFVIVRCNPGQIKADGGDQGKFDDGMRALRKAGKQIWPSPDVMEKMGAKDALCKVATMNIGLEDTLAYYTPEEFAAGFKKTMAFQPRVIKQNRGSSGEGIWIIKLKENNYCSTYGERSCEDGEKLVLMEANDNHEEEHTVAEFIEFCVAGRTDKSGTWTSKGVGKYLEGGKAAGGQLVDQRFCPRIVEGELRYNLIGDSLIGVIHKKPAEGGISAVGGTGSIYTFYGPDEPLFKSLTENFLGKAGFSRYKHEDTVACFSSMLHAYDLNEQIWTSKSARSVTSCTKTILRNLCQQIKDCLQTPIFALDGKSLCYHSGFAKSHACTGLGWRAFATLVDNGLHQCLAARQVVHEFSVGCNSAHVCWILLNLFVSKRLTRCLSKIWNS